MARNNSFVAPFVVFGASFCGLYALADFPTVRRWFQDSGLTSQLSNIQIILNGMVSTSLATIYKIVKWYLQPPQTPPPGQSNTTNIPLPAQNPGRDWRKAYHDLYVRADALLKARDLTKAGVEDELFNTREEVLERRAALKLTLYSGLAFALGSCVTTAIFPPGNPGPSNLNPVRHFLFLSTTYLLVALFFAFGALVRRGRPYRKVPLLMFGVAASYVNLCALLISIPYTLNLMLAAHVPPIFGLFSLPVWIGITRLALEPFAAIVGTIFGTILGGAYLQATQPPSS
jgi:hypothetical protein